MKNISCPGCGHTNLWDSRFCENCGCDLSAAKTVKKSAPPVPKKEKKSHLGLVLGITIPVIVIGIVVILFLTGVIKVPFLSGEKKFAGTWYQFAVNTPADGLRSLEDIANLQDKKPNDVRLMMTINEDGTGQMIEGGVGSSEFKWAESDGTYTIVWKMNLYTGTFETDDEFTMKDTTDTKLYFSRDINHQIPNQVEVTPSPTPSPIPTPTPEPYYETSTEDPEADMEEDVWQDTDLDEEEDETDNEYIFPNSDSEYLAKSDLKGMSKSEINLAKNELYARHGRKFKSKELQDYFNSKSWYQGIYSPKQWDKKGDNYFFNKYEIKNRNLLKKYEQ